MTSGDPPAPATALTWRQAVETHYDALCKAAWFVMGDEEAATDVAHQGMLKAQKSWDPAKIRNPRTYLLRCVHNAGIDALRANKRKRDRHIQGDGVLESLDVADAPTRDGDLWRFVQEQLTAREWEVVCLTFLCGCSRTEVADELQVKTGAVGVAKHRALKKLADAFGTPDVLQRYLGRSEGASR